MRDAYKIINGHKATIDLDKGASYIIEVSPTHNKNIKEFFENKMRESKSNNNKNKLPTFKKTITPNSKHNKLTFYID